jgi:inner membrane protein
MDPPTHALLGATIGRTLFGRRLGAGAAWCGAIGSVLPDADLVAVAFAGPLGEWRYHRGLTHALCFGPVVGTAIGAWWWRRAKDRWRWVALFVLALVVHPLLDALTSYGTQLLWPFSHRRFALDAVAIVDLMYTAPLLAAVVLAASHGPAGSRALGAVVLALTTAYLAYGLWLNRRDAAEARRQLAAEGAPHAVHCYPTLLQPWFRRVVARSEDEVRVGWMNVGRAEVIHWARVAVGHDPLLEALRATPDGRMFEWFAGGQTLGRVRREAGGAVVEIDDLRYGYPERPDQGLWAIRATFDDQGRQTSAVVRVNRRPPGGRGAQLAHIWRAMLGQAR